MEYLRGKCPVLDIQELRVYRHTEELNCPPECVGVTETVVPIGRIPEYLGMHVLRNCRATGRIEKRVVLGRILALPANVSSFVTADDYVERYAPKAKDP